jgi:hypothetical protein
MKTFDDIQRKQKGSAASQTTKSAIPINIGSNVALNSQ